jgi:hypothetical protein
MWRELLAAAAPRPAAEAVEAMRPAQVAAAAFLALIFDRDAGHERDQRR